MKQIRLTRIASNPNEGTFGTWTLDGQPICLTLEPYSRSNAVSVSCIPTGQYILKRYDSPKYGSVWMVTEVEGRSYILVHWGNWDHNSKGCIILGEGFSVIDGKWAVSSSKLAFKEFMKLTAGETELNLTIVDAF